MEFWGMELHPKQAKPIKCEENSYLHLTQAALGTNPKDGERVVLQIGFDKEKFVLGTLVKSTCDQMHLDLLVDKDFTLEHNGSSSVFVAGYVTAADFEGAELDSEDEEEDDDEDEEDEDGDEEEEEAVVNAAKGNGLPEKKGKKQADGIASKAKEAAAKLGVAKAALESLDKERKKAQAEEDDEEDDEDDDEDDDNEEGAVLRGANEFDMDDDEDDDLSDDDDEFADDLAEEGDSEDDDIEEGDFSDDDDDEDDDEDDDMDEDGEGIENAPPLKGAKRPATIPKTPASQKKARVEAATPKTPAATPSAKKTPGKDKTPAPEKTPKTPAASGTLGKYHCQPCGKNFTAETALKQHNQAKHKE